VPTMHAPHQAMDAAESRLHRRPEPPQHGIGPSPGPASPMSTTYTPGGEPDERDEPDAHR
jgi:hypothetical protein